MRDEIAKEVFPVFREAIEIKQGLKTYPRNYEFAKSRRKLLGLLPNPPELRGEFCGEYSPPPPPDMNSFLGIRYALACWLDEVFIRDTMWSELFRNESIEVEVFLTSLRYEEFWNQAERAENRTSYYALDTLEVFYLCVMLGFRGRPMDLDAWRETVEDPILNVQQYAPPPPINVGADVEPLVGQAAMERWLFVLTLVGMAFIPVLIWLLFPSGRGM